MFVTQFQTVTLGKIKLMISDLYSNLLVEIITLISTKNWRWRKIEKSVEELQGVTFFCTVNLCDESMRTTETTPFILIEQKSIYLPPLSNDKKISHGRNTASLHPFKVTKSLDLEHIYIPKFVGSYLQWGMKI